MRLQRTKVLPDIQLLSNLRRAAKIFHEYVDHDILVVYSKSKQGPFYLYEFHAGKENFQHLAGIKYPKGAVIFFDKCFNGIVERKDIIPKDNIKVTSMKIEVLPIAIDLKNSKMYRIGKKNLCTELNQFSVAIGNTNSVMGIDKRNSLLPIPITVVKDNISKYCSDTLNIFLIMTKNIEEKKYSNVLFEKISDILHKAVFPEEILEKIESGLYEVEKKIMDEVVVESENDLIHTEDF